MLRRAWILFALASAAPATPLRAQSLIDTLALEAHTYFLSHDLLAGRATGSPGAHLAAAYIASQCRELGLVPVGPTYSHDVALEEATVGTGTEVTLVGALGARTYGYPNQFTPNVGDRSTLVDFAGPVVYLGPPEELTDETLTAQPLAGAVVALLGPRASVESMDMLKNLGVVGAILLVPDSSTYALYRNSRGSTRLYHADDDITSSFLPPMPAVIAGPELSYAVVAGLPRDRDGQPLPSATNWEATTHLDLHSRPVAAQNVACLLRGQSTAAADTAIALSAHYDHLGIVASGSPTDSIYNGFSDNAAGVAALLAVAKAMTSDSMEPMRHSVLFLFFVGEERGLLGSDHYVARPAWQLSRTKALINIDAGAPPGRPVSWRLAGVDTTGLGSVALEVAHSRGWTVTTSPPRANSDYYPFVREGVPAVFIIPGPDPYQDLTADSSATLREKWDHYHQPADEWSEDFPFGGLARYAEFAQLIVRALDVATIEPRF